MAIAWLKLRLSRLSTFLRRPTFWLGFLVVAALAAAGIAFWRNTLHYESTDDAFIDGRVIAISPQVSARVSRVPVNDNALVRKGDILIELDAADYQVALDQARAANASAEGKLQQARSGIAVAQAMRDQIRAEIESVRSTYENAEGDLRRYEALDERARAKQKYDSAIAAQKSAKAKVAETAAKLATAEAQITTAEAVMISAKGDLEKASADVHRAELNIGYCRIIAPEAGRITRKNVEAGANVIAGQPLLALVPAEVWIIANFKETQLDLVRPGQPVTISVDAYPDRALTGKVDSVQAGTGARFSVLPAENATGNFVKIVQRVPVKIVLDPGMIADPDRPLVPGMSVAPKVRVR